MDDVTYTGAVSQGRYLVYRNGAPFQVPKQLLRRRKSASFRWGAAVPAAFDLSFSLLLDTLGNHPELVKLAVDFRRNFVSLWSTTEPWSIGRELIRSWVAGQEAPPADPAPTPTLEPVPQATVEQRTSRRKRE